MSDTNSEVITEHFRCVCGHQWQREMYDGLVAVDCPICKCQHKTTLGRVFSRLTGHTARDFAVGEAGTLKAAPRMKED
jgi:hypothetical protein